MYIHITTIARKCECIKFSHLTLSANGIMTYKNATSSIANISLATFGKPSHINRANPRIAIKETFIIILYISIKLVTK